MVFGAIKRALKGASREVQADYSKNRDFLEAVCAGAALVAAADGEIEDSERRKLMQLITGHSKLSVMYDHNTIEQTAERMFKLAKDSSGRQQLARELDDLKGKENGAQMAEDVYLLSADIANADGELEPQEVEVLKKIANRLGVDPTKFEF